MAEITEISWTDATFNPWEGCQKVGPGCDNCYAEARNARFGGGQAINWGPGAPRRRTSVQNWNKPVRWNTEPFFECPDCGLRGDAKAMGDAPKACQHLNAKPARMRVFCSSLADVFDNAVDPAWQSDLMDLIRATPNLDWLLLTKRIGNVRALMGEAGFRDWPNVWLGATVVNQEEADRDIPKLLAVPARVRFLSMEPLLGPVDLAYVRARISAGRSGITKAVCYPGGEPWVDWVIAGGESGPGARPMHPDWARSLRDQCAAAGVPFHFKQWGEYAYLGKSDDGDHGLVLPIKVGKKAAGRLLDGVTHDAFPEVSSG